MPLYAYQAFSKEGKKVNGHVDASSLSSAREKLVSTGLFPVKIIVVDEGTQGKNFLRRLFERSVSFKDKIFFTKQLSVLLKSGVPLLQALELLIEQTEGQLRSIAVALKDGVKEGRSLADGLSLYPKIFDNTYIQLVRAGEATGKLEVILDRLTTYLERTEALQKKVSKALRGPLIQLGMIGVIVIFMLNFVVPNIAEVFEGQDAQLPFSTRILMGLSSIFRNHWLLLALSTSVLVVAFLFWKSTASGKRTLDALKLKIPLVRYFAKMGAVVQFCRTLGMLVEGGVNLAEALTIVVNIVDNSVLVDALNQARENIIKQGKVAFYLKQTGFFPPVALYLINTGEQSGQLGQMLITVAEHYEVELSELADGLAEQIDPVMKIVMAIIVGFVVLSIVTPMMNMTEILNR
jgi:type II secretory pathway component PulF